MRGRERRSHQADQVDRPRLPKRGAILGACFVTALCISVPAAANYGGELRELYRGARMTGMGGAFVAIADDEQAIWVNPAGLSGVRKTQLHYAVADIEFSNDIASELLSGTPTLQALGSGNLNAVIGKNIYARVQVSPALLMPGWGIGFLSDHQFGAIIKNMVFPNTTVAMQSTNGVQIAQSFALTRKGRRRGLGGGELRAGIAAKALWRRGGYNSIPMPQLLNLSTDYILALAGTYGFGFGLDLGTQYVRSIGNNTQVSLGLAYTDIGDIAFSNGADSQKGNLSAGAGLVYKSAGFDFTFAADYRHINVDTDVRKRIHAGFEFALPLVKVYGGLNQTLPVYGASVDIWLLRVTALTYSEARGQTLGQDDERRWLTRLDAKFAF